nr:putative RNA-directed DNA polymerase, eukaryota, reverse transcriptase zinc-binding domain protein [Tanacetum cinerariifolium]
MGSFRSKEDDVARISTSIYITNFPESFSAKDLFHSCKVYGHVVDSFIPWKRSKEGKRFGFVRFINVFNIERLVSNLCTIWVGRLKFHANVARFNRNPKNDDLDAGKKTTEGCRGSQSVGSDKSDGKNGFDKSFVHVVKGINSVKEVVDDPAIVLDETCFNTKEMSTSLIARMKELAAISNLKKVLRDEGFDELKIKYLGELWVLLEFPSNNVKDAFRTNVGEFRLNSGRVRRSIRLRQSKTYWIRAKEVSGWISEFEEESDDDEISVDGNDIKEHNDGEELDVEEVPKTVFEESAGIKQGHLEDPFEIFPLLNKEKSDGHEKSKESDHNGDGLGDMLNGKLNDQEGNSATHATLNVNSEATSFGRFKNSTVPRNGGSILDLLEEVVKVGKIMGYKMDRCEDNITEIIESQGVTINLLCVKRCWGNLAFDYVHSDSIGNSGAGLEEVPLGGSRYTWCHRSATKISKLDRFLASENLLNSCPRMNAITLDLSDHRPILLRESACDYGPIPFWFFHYWMDVEGFDKLVAESWMVAPIVGKNSIQIFMSKLKFLKTKIKDWVVEYKRNTPGLVSNLKQNLVDLDAEIDKGKGDDVIVSNRLEIINQIQGENKIKALETAQKAKIRWYVEGDENNKFFHGMLNKKRSQLNIRGIMINDKWTGEPVEVKWEFFQHFSDRFSEPITNRASIDMNFPNTLSLEQKEDPERNISMEEVKKAVWDCGMDKSPGPDGYTFGFYRRFWSIIEHDVFEAVQYFFNHEDMPKGCNSNFITLIPKISDAKLAKDFRPISLIGSLYKIIAKILTNRLVSVLAYDSMRWDYLDEVLDKFGFGGKWRGWIQGCLKSSRGSILINGSPTKEFQFNKGLKQGDPLSPFLFILIMKSLHISFQRVVDAGLYNGLRLSSTVNLSHLFYAGDAMFVGKWCDSNIGVTPLFVKKTLCHNHGVSSKHS